MDTKGGLVNIRLTSRHRPNLAINAGTKKLPEETHAGRI